MKILLYSLSLLQAVNAYNILELDGGGIRGMIGCILISHMENKSYEYAVQKKYDLPKYNHDHKKIHMVQLFDMLAGTSTGSIMAGLLTVPDPKHPNQSRFFINETIKLYRNNGTDLFKSNLLSTGASLGIGSATGLLLGLLMYFTCRHYLENKAAYNKLRRAQIKADALYLKYE